MKRSKISAIILSLAILTACNSEQSVQTSETISETEVSTVTTTAETKTETTTSIITTAAETEAEQPADDISEADKELLKLLTDETGMSEDVLLEYARKIDNFDDIQRGYVSDGIYDFNGDGVPEIYVGGWEMITPYAAVYDIRKGDPEYIFGMTAKMDFYDNIYDGNIELYYDRKENKYFYYAMTSYWFGGTVGDSITYTIEQNRIDADFENHILGEEQHSQEDFSDEDEWKSACEEAEKELCNYVLIDTLRTLKEPYFYEEEGSYGLRLLHSYFRNNSNRRLAMLLNETGVSGLTFHMTPDEVKELLGEPKEFIDETEDFNAVTLKYDSGRLTFVDLEKDGNYQLAFMRLYSFDFCKITENTSRSELISALKDMGIYPEPAFPESPENETLENTEQITAGEQKGLQIGFDMDGDRIEYLTALFIVLT
ncbi:MAG: hypothetical protein K2J76_00230 [Oscillospiraceae bacterium]|nr:hypothetical protein [Oscillospiraceae bacterium]